MWVDCCCWGCIGELLIVFDDWEWGLINWVVKEGLVVEVVFIWLCG